MTAPSPGKCRPNLTALSDLIMYKTVLCTQCKLTVGLVTEAICFPGQVGFRGFEGGAYVRPVLRVWIKSHS